ncbi:unnamed protein product [Diplocarpon coronariae]
MSRPRLKVSRDAFAEMNNAAMAYCRWAWYFEYELKTKELSHFIANYVDSKVSELEVNTELSDVQRLMIQNRLLATGKPLIEYYIKVRVEAGLPIFRPTYTMDVTEPEARLSIQMEYDVRREALHIASLCVTVEQMAKYRSDGGRTYFWASPLMPATLKVEAELKILAHFGDAVTDARAWLPAEVAELLDMSRDTRPLQGNWWSIYRAYIKYFRIDDVVNQESELSLEVFGAPVKSDNDGKSVGDEAA